MFTVIRSRIRMPVAWLQLRGPGRLCPGIVSLGSLSGGRRPGCRGELERGGRFG